MTLESQTRARQPAPAAPSRTRATRLVLFAAGLATAINVAVYATAKAFDAPMVVPDATPSDVNVGMVVAGTLGSMLLGALALLIARRWAATGWRVVAWIGLAVGLLSALIPLSADASGGTRAALASMHVVTGIVWWEFLLRAVRRHGD